MSRRTISIRQRLLRHVVAMVLLIGLAMLSLTYIGERTATRLLAQSLTVQTLGWTEAKLQTGLSPVEGVLAALQDWGERGLLDFTDRRRLSLMLAPLLEHSPWVSSLVLADATGREHMLLRLDDGWRGREIDTPGTARLLAWQDWDAVPAGSVEALDYDPRVRPWYVGAAARMGPPGGEPTRSVHWTEPYRFFTTGDHGLSVAGGFRAPDGTLGVVTLDVRLTDLSAFTAATRVHRSGFVAALTADGRLLGAPLSPELADLETMRAALLQTPAALQDILSMRVLERLLAAERNGAGPHRVHVDGARWWGMLRSFALSGEERVDIAVGVPEAELLKELERLRRWILWVTLGALTVGIAVAVPQARRLSRPIEQLVAESRRISAGDLSAGPPIETRLTEVRQLVQAHDHMRTSLATLMKLEQDLRLAREIQESTYPHTLPALAGFDIAAWCAPADETGGDSYDVIGVCLGPNGEPAGFTEAGADRVVLMLADAAGHGVGPALSVLQVRASLRMALRMTTDLADIVTHLNEQLCADLPEGRFVTGWFGLIAAGDATLRSLSAGQAPLLHYRAADDSFRELAGDSLPLGLFDLGPNAPGPTLALGADDVFAVLSDGIYEAYAPDGEQFGVARVQQVLRAERGQPAAQCIAALRAAVERFMAGRPPEDDRTILIIRRVGQR